MQENTVSSSSRQTYGLVGIDDAVNEVLTIYPELKDDGGKLLTLFERAWRGEWPVQFIEDIARLCRHHLWFKNQLDMMLGSIRLPTEYIPNNFELYKSHQLLGMNENSGIVSRKMTSLAQWEALLILSKLHFGPYQNECAHGLLERILDLVDKPNSSYMLEEHPLKSVLIINDVFKKDDNFAQIDYPQKFEKLAHSICAKLPIIKSIYPRVGKFLDETIIPLICGEPVVWVCPSGFDQTDVLDTDKPPQLASDINGNEINIHGYEARLPAILDRVFTAADLCGELIAYDRSIERYKNELTKLSKAWRGENTLRFYSSVGAITCQLPWLKEVLKKTIKPGVFGAIRKYGRNTLRRLQSEEREFHRAAANWREVSGIKHRRSAEEVRDSFNPASYGKGIDNLRGLLLLGRLKWTPSENVAAQDALIELIHKVDKIPYAWIMDNKDLINLEPIHLVRLALTEVNKLETSEQLASAIIKILPYIEKYDHAAAIHIAQAYLPLLDISNIEDIAVPVAQKNDIKKSILPTRKMNETLIPETRRMRISIPSRQNPIVGESIEETAPSFCVLRRTETNENVNSLKEEIRWVHQRIYGSNQLLIRNHIESLSDAETQLFISALENRIDLAIAEHDSNTGWMCIILALTIITGQSIGTWTALEVCLNENSKKSVIRPQLILSKGILRLPIVRPDGAFKPKDSMRKLLERTSTTVDLHLPPAIRCWLDNLHRINMPKWGVNENELRGSLEDLVTELEPHVGTGISLARIRLVARARMRSATNDLASTMMLCGDTFGQSTASLYYTNVNIINLENGFITAAWPLFANQPDSNFLSNHNIRVGSELLVTAKTALALAKSVSVASYTHDSDKLVNNKIIKKHNGLVDHILRMIIATAGHRPTSALFELTRFDFDTVKHAAVFKDKQCDAAHLYRFLPTADMLSVQLEKYLDHLRALMASAHSNPAMSDHAKAAIYGFGPLFFHLCPESKPYLLQLSTWRNTLPSLWQEIPLNWGRTWLASRGREAGIDADHLSIMLGHLDAAGYPYSNESPLEPAQLSRELSGKLGKMIKASGWRARNGLTSTQAKNVHLVELGPLKDWVTERTQLANLSNEYRFQQRQVLRSTLRDNQINGEKIALTSLEHILQQPIVDFDYLMGFKTSHNDAAIVSDEKAKDLKLALTAECIESIQNKIYEETDQNKILQIAAHNALYRYLKLAKKKLHWDCPIPSPWLAPSTLEPTPFFPGIFRATNQVHALRQDFGRMPVKVPIGSSFTPFEWACGQTIIALCIFGFIDSESQILEILKGRQSAVRSSAIKDLLLVETGEDKRVVGIRGIASLALASLKSNYPENDLPSLNTLNSVIASQLPSALSGNSFNVLSRLCSTVSVTNIVELSGLARMSLEQSSGCVAMSVARQRQMLEDGFGIPDETSINEPFIDTAAVQLPLQKRTTSSKNTQYRKLREILYIGDGPKKFKNTGEQLTQANIGAFRNSLCREITAFLNDKELDPLVACIAAFALHMTTYGTFNKHDPAWSTVYSYITSFGLDLVDIAADVDFLELEEEEFIDLYQDVIDRKSSSKSRWLAARELVNFHRYLQEHHGFESVDFSDLEGLGVRPEIQVDAEIIQPKEFEMGLNQLNLRAAAYELNEIFSADTLRTNRQAEVYALLLRHSRARHNELSALRFIDILATLNSLILFIRPSRYRSLKTPAARRMVDISDRLTPQQRLVISNWINAEKLRLNASWKPTLPIFGLLEAPKDRVSSRELRDKTLSALEEAVGCHTKIHRARHLGACEDILAIILSDVDLKALYNASMTIHLPRSDMKRPSILLPRHIRELTLDMGHRRSSTTMINYFHLTWALTSRPHQYTLDYLDNHAVSVALGTGYSNVFKIGYRANKKLALPNDIGFESMDAWLTHLIDQPTPTPGKSVNHIFNKRIYSSTNPLKGRNVERILRDIQRDIPLNEICLAHGITGDQLQRLKIVTEALQIKVGFSFWPINCSKQRSARAFQEASRLEEILDLMDREKYDPDRQLVLSVSRAYLLWAYKSMRDKILLPNYESSRLCQLLFKFGFIQSQVIITESEERSGFSHIKLLRLQDPKQHLNQYLAWLLVVACIVEEVNEP